MYISRLELTNWKNFKAAEAPLARRMFLIGPNASGKSNLLDAFRFLRDVAARGLAEGVGMRGGVSRIRCLAARASSTIGIGVTLSDADDNPRWSYELEFNQDANRTPEVKRERVVDLRSDREIADRPNEDDERDALLLTQTALEQIIANREFREIAEFFKTISYQHVVPQAVRDPQGFSPGQIHEDPFGRDLLLRIWNTSVQTRQAWLKRIANVLQSAVPQLKSLDVEMDESQGLPHLVGRYEHWRANAAKQTEAQFSDGTLRLFGLMWSLFEGRGPLLLEEPELSLHPKVVEQLPGLLHKLQLEIKRMRRKGAFEHRQIIISTHSENLLGDSVGAHEVLRLKPSSEGTTLHSPDERERALLEAGLSAGQVLLPAAAPEQLDLLPAS